MAITFSAKLKDDGSLTVPKEAVEQLGLHPGDEVQVHLESANGAIQTDESDQTTLQAKFERFLEKLDALTFEKPAKFPAGDPAEAAFVEAMDEKFRKLGFKG
ncbi:MAG TPA: AbrB/MazE/SpoVT family DNA-binding domain-containing protein [Chthonomonadaceae bacterium]|nr:AbrB/MazE/SpoVT family DNA-binding domain-containing protein [Chthonomonadaceae bacterium]